MSYRDQFLSALRDAGDKGVPNYELSKIALQYNFVIHQLRKSGYTIRRKAISKGTSYYILEEYTAVPAVSAPPVEAPPTLLDIEPLHKDIWKER
jgi:hypothetical protein